MDASTFEQTEDSSFSARSFYSSEKVEFGLSGYWFQGTVGYSGTLTISFGSSF